MFYKYFNIQYNTVLNNKQFPIADYYHRCTLYETLQTDEANSPIFYYAITKFKIKFSSSLLLSISEFILLFTVQPKDNFVIRTVKNIIKF